MLLSTAYLTTLTLAVLAPTITAQLTCTPALRLPKPQAQRCGVLGTLGPNAAKNALSTISTTGHGPCARACVDTRGCKLFGYTASNTSCTLYQRTGNKLGFQPEQADTRYWSSGCYVGECEVGASIAGQPASGDPYPFLHYYTGSGATLDPNNPASNGGTPSVFTIPDLSLEQDRDAVQACADAARPVGMTGTYDQTFDVHYRLSLAAWECVNYAGISNSAGLYDVADNDVFVGFGYAAPDK